MPVDSMGIRQQPSQTARDLLYTIRKKGQVKYDDLDKILKLDKVSQEYLINRISVRRRGILMKCLDNFPKMKKAGRGGS